MSDDDDDVMPMMWNLKTILHQDLVPHNSRLARLYSMPIKCRCPDRIRGHPVACSRPRPVSRGLAMFIIQCDNGFADQVSLFVFSGVQTLFVHHPVVELSTNRFSKPAPRLTVSRCLGACRPRAVLIHSTQ